MSTSLKERCKIKKVDLVPRNIVVRELTVAEVEDVFNGFGSLTRKTESNGDQRRDQDNKDQDVRLEDLNLHIIDMLYAPAFPSRVIAISTGEDLDDLVAEFTQEELAEIIAGVEEVNQRLKKMYVRLAEAGQKILAGKASPSPSPG